MSKCNIERPAGVCPHRKWDGECVSDKYCAHQIEPPKPKTNADRIRSMTDAELARHFADNICEYISDFDYAWCDRRLNCKNCVIEWLKQPHEEEV